MFCDKTLPPLWFLWPCTPHCDKRKETTPSPHVHILGIPALASLLVVVRLVLLPWALASVLGMSSGHP